MQLSKIHKSELTNTPTERFFYGAAGKVDGLHHAAGGNHPQHGVHVGPGRVHGPVQRVRQQLPCLHLHGVSLLAGGLHQRIKVGQRGRGVATQPAWNGTNEE